MSVPLLSLVLCGLLLSAVSAAVTNQPSPAGEGDEQHTTRKPLPGPEVIAELPPDGGPEFNRLVFESSPYLRQHARNPVDWWPWGPEAFAYAEQVDKPVFLSIGYATCHWCHVMEHESFEDDEVAALMNEHFVCIKVDREERPDVDQIYMTVTQGLTRGGGWPMTVVMTPDKEPFFAGTYFPKRRRGQQPGMLELVPGLAAQWHDDREGLVQRAGELREWLAQVSRTEPGAALEPATLNEAFEGLLARQDAVNGGFGEQRKFPSPSNLRFLLRYALRASADGRSEQAEQALAMVTRQLDAMQRGGIWDHVGKGIHRYATDSRWFLPHFEKMLYDQALVSLVATETWQLTGDARWRRLAEDIYEYVLRDLTAPEGGFYSAEDADSEGEEGLFYLWRPEELVAALGEEDGALAIELYGVEQGGNFREESNGKPTGESLLYLEQSVPDFAASRGLDPDELAARVESIRRRLFEVREPRVHPFKDDKLLTDWNGLMIASLALAGRAFDEPDYTAAAVRAADFCLAELRREDGSLMKRWRAGEAGLDGVLEDYAFLTFGLIELYQTCFEPRFLQAAIELTDHSLAHFWDAEQGGFYTASDTTTDLIVRAKESYDGALPAGNSVSASNLVRLSRLTGNTQYEERAELLFKAFARPVRRSPIASPWLLSALDFSFGPSFEIVVAGQPGAEDVTRMLAAIARPFLPSKVVVLRPAGPDPAIAELVPYTADQEALDGRATAYVCQNFACQAPTTDLAAVLEALGVE